MTCKHTRDVAWVGLLDGLKLWLLNFLLDGRSQNFNLPAVCCKGDFSNETGLTFRDSLDQLMFSDHEDACIRDCGCSL